MYFLFLCVRSNKIYIQLIIIIFIVFFRNFIFKGFSILKLFLTFSICRFFRFENDILDLICRLPSKFHAKSGKTGKMSFSPICIIILVFCVLNLNKVTDLIQCIFSYYLGLNVLFSWFRFSL